MKKLLALSILIAGLGFSLTAVVQADHTTQTRNIQPPAGLQLTDNGGLDNPDKVIPLFNRIINWIFAILVTMAVIFLLLAAWEYLTSRGGEGVSKAHKMLLYSAIALAVAFLARGIVNVVRIIITNPSN